MRRARRCVTIRVTDLGSDVLRACQRDVARVRSTAAVTARAMKVDRRLVTSHVGGNASVPVRMTERLGPLTLALVVAAIAPAPVAAQATVPAYGYAPAAGVRCGSGGVCTAGASCADGRCVTPYGAVVEAERADPEYDRRGHVHRKLMIAGGIVLGVGWLVNVVMSAFAGYHVDIWGSSDGYEPGWDDFRGVGFIPLAGPWIQLGMNRDGALWDVYLPIDALVQLIGATLLVVGIVLEENNHPEEPAFVLAPMLGDGRAGLVVGGAF